MNTGMRTAIKMAMIKITIISSMSVKPASLRRSARASRCSRSICHDSLPHSVACKAISVPDGLGPGEDHRAPSPTVQDYQPVFQVLAESVAGAVLEQSPPLL